VRATVARRNHPPTLRWRGMIVTTGRIHGCPIAPHEVADDRRGRDAAQHEHEEGKHGMTHVHLAKRSIPDAITRSG
jgi:hypothetical protein